MEIRKGQTETDFPEDAAGVILETVGKAHGELD
jgi:hypothetical protein